MMTQLISISHPGGHLVPMPRPTDAIGNAFQRVFECVPVSNELQRLLQQLDHTHRA